MRNRTIALAGVLAGALLLTACGDDSDGTTSSTPGGAGSSSSESASADFNDADVAFVTGMKPHHAQAVEMSDMILDADPPAEVTALAERIKAAQTPEIAELDEMIERFGAEDVSGGGHGAGHGGGEDGEAAGHAGMMTDEQMSELDAATGSEAARLWLTMMIEHHQGAIEAAQTELADGKHQPALDLAERIKADQAEEIAEMEQLLTQL